MGYITNFEPATQVNTRELLTRVRELFGVEIEVREHPATSFAHNPYYRVASLHEPLHSLWSAQDIELEGEWWDYYVAHITWTGKYAHFNAVWAEEREAWKEKLKKRNT